MTTWHYEATQEPAKYSISESKEQISGDLDSILGKDQHSDLIRHPGLKGMKSALLNQIRVLILRW